MPLRNTTPLSSLKSPVTIGAALTATARLLSSDQEPDVARVEAEVLLGHCLGIDRVQLYCRLDSDLSTETTEHFRALLERRLAGEPVAYITGSREFYGLDFYVDRRVLIPRPETEIMVEAVVKRYGIEEFPTRHRTTDGIVGADRRVRPRKGPKIADVGTGSGAIAISLAMNLPHAHIVAVDSSSEALEVAAKNVDRHAVGDRIRLAHGDLLEPVGDQIDVVVANLPYIRRSALGGLPRDVREHEPVAALDGGEDGLDFYRRLLPQAVSRLINPGWILIEVDPEQVEAALELARRHFPTATASILKDYAGLDRVVSIDARWVEG